MNSEDKTRVAAGESDALPPAPKDPNQQYPTEVRRDISYSPASETETERKQEDPLPDTVDDDIDPDDVRAVPGTGGPDDVGDVDVEADDLNLPWQP